MSVLGGIMTLGSAVLLTTLPAILRYRALIEERKKLILILLSTGAYDDNNDDHRGGEQQEELFVNNNNNNDQSGPQDGQQNHHHHSFKNLDPNALFKSTTGKDDENSPTDTSNIVTPRFDAKLDAATDDMTTNTTKLPTFVRKANADSVVVAICEGRSRCLILKQMLKMSLSRRC